MRYLLAALIRIYQLVISPHFPSCCRYQPTCSQYARDAVLKHGAARGSWISIKRILRCHPLSSGGFDPVPDSPESEQTSSI